MKRLKDLYWNKNVRHWFGLLTLLAISVAGMNLHYEAGLLMGSILDIQEHAAFDGTSLPIQQVPIAYEDFDRHFSELSPEELEPAPLYNNDYFEFPSDQLEWGNPEHAPIWQSKRVYSVPYAGTYSLDSAEYEGSHPAVDIVVPEGTPVHAIANGIAITVGSSSGFGKSIVIKHENVPEPGNPSRTTSVYSSYSHLSELFIAEGDLIQRNAVIGAVGDSGTATTHHLHFQLDSDLAPWHPYWPFTTAEASAAGYSFWEAVNYGVGLDNLLANTYNPISWAQDYLTDAEPLPAPVSVIIETIDEVEEVIVEEVLEVEEELIVESAIEYADFDRIQVEGPDFIMVGDNKQVTVKLLDFYGELLETTNFTGELELSVSNSDLATLNKNRLTAVDFVDGEAELEVYATFEGDVEVIFDLGSREYSSNTLRFISEIEPFAKFGISVDGNFVPGLPETIQIQALDITGKPTPNFSGRGTVKLALVEGSGEFSVDELTKSDFPNGIARVEFTSDSDEPVVIKSVYGTKVSESARLYSRIFTDFDETDDYYKGVSYLWKKNTISGYPDGTFQADRSVSRVEAVKLILSGTDQELRDDLTINFSDTENGQWYSNFVATAQALGAIEGYPDGRFKPTQGVNKVEFLKMLFSVADISIDPVVTSDPYADVNNLAWFAPYVQFSRVNNLFPDVTGENFEPSEPMSRVQVSEVIYRLIASQQNDGVPYTARLNVE